MTQKLVFTKAMFYPGGKDCKSGKCKDNNGKIIISEEIVKNYPMKDCDEKSFTDSEFQKEYADFLFNRGTKRIRQCVDDPNDEIYLQGQRDSNIYKQNNTWIFLQIDKLNCEV